MRVNLAAQVLSHSVAAGISFLVTCKELPEEAIHTAHFVEHFDNLFNTFNSRSLRSSQSLVMHLMIQVVIMHFCVKV